ncbi:MAG: hypothetical protein ACKO96_34145 [Flammeovirgaceae bacterium]
MEMITKVHEIRLSSQIMGFVILLLNFLFPGFGTIIAGALGDALIPGIVVGILQWILFPFFGIGYFWGLYVGYKCIVNSK